MNAKAMGANLLLAADDNEYRRAMTMKLGIADFVEESAKAQDLVMQHTAGRGVEKAFDARGTTAGRQAAVEALREYGSATFMGEGEEFSMSSRSVMRLIHGERRIEGSWAVPLWEIEELLELIQRWKIHPSDIITHRYALKDIDIAFRTAIRGNCGKVAIVDFE